MNRNVRYLTTSIFYANGQPHMGHALELVQADFARRYLACFTERTPALQIGMDEHGLKVQRAAEQAGQDPQAYVDGLSEVFRRLADDLQVEYARFIRTTDADHREMAQAVWRLCRDRGDIYKKTYRAWYDVKEEEFLGLADEVHDPSVFGVDPQFLELIEEENYFFAASNYTQAVLDLLRTQQYRVWPANRASELINFIESKGLQDISISRDRRKLSWGIPVPDDEQQVMYVWFDALTNYLTGAAKVVDGQIVLSELWPAHGHFVGKDIARFHGLLWPAMLLSAGLPLPLNLNVHGHLLSAGRKMSKSLGNGIDPQVLLDRYGSDALRWFFLAEVPTLDDGDVTEARVGEVYASSLANEYGNLVSRVVAMTRKYNEGRVPNISPDAINNAERAVVEEAIQAYHHHVIDMRFDAALAEAQGLVRFCNRRIDELKPWELAKDEGKRAELEELLYELLEIIRLTTILLRPAMPATSARVLGEILPGASQECVWGALQGGLEVSADPVVLFPRVEV